MSKSGKMKYRWYDDEDDYEYSRRQKSKRLRDRRRNKKMKSYSKQNRFMEIEDIDRDDEY